MVIGNRVRCSCQLWLDNLRFDSVSPTQGLISRGNPCHLWLDSPRLDSSLAAI
jgi:hypothetical protein